MCVYRRLVAVLVAGLVLVLAVGCGGSDEEAEVASGATVSRGTIEGRVTGADGEPVQGALIVPTSLDQPSHAIPEIAIVSNEDGHYSWRLFPGRYTLTVTADGFVRAAQTTTLDPGGTVELDFTLERSR